ncbi:MAG: SpoIIE family protein phosphatase [Solirubrobacterales bacterium]|nr:SpoIIE family protein phosphatase [Solirubrobacterales bacterium]
MPDGLLATADALAHADLGITVGDAGRRGFPLVYVNEAFERMTGYRAEELIGRSCSFLQEDVDVDPRALGRLREALRDGREARAVLRNRRRDGRPFWNELRLVPLRDEHGVRFFLGFQLDVTSAVDTVRDLRELLSGQQRELEELRALRDALTPPASLVHPTVDIATAFVPAESGVAGDFFLVAESPGSSVTVAVGDAVGHGLRAAKQASFVRTSLSTFAAFTDDPQRLLELANYSLLERTGARPEFVTCVCANLRPEQGEVVVASAGHPVPLRLDDASEVAAGAQGRPLGIDLDLRGRAGRAPLPTGGGLLLYSDGLPEARRVGERGREMFGPGRISAGLHDVQGATPRATIDALVSRVRGFASGPLRDDLCAVAVRRSS